MGSTMGSKKSAKATVRLGVKRATRYSLPMSATLSPAAVRSRLISKIDRRVSRPMVW